MTTDGGGDDEDDCPSLLPDDYCWLVLVHLQHGQDCRVLQQDT